MWHATKRHWACFWNSRLNFSLWMLKFRILLYFFLLWSHSNYSLRRTLEEVKLTKCPIVTFLFVFVSGVYPEHSVGWSIMVPLSVPLHPSSLSLRARWKSLLNRILRFSPKLSYRKEWTTGHSKKKRKGKEKKQNRGNYRILKFAKCSVFKQCDNPPLPHPPWKPFIICRCSCSVLCLPFFFPEALIKHRLLFWLINSARLKYHMMFCPKAKKSLPQLIKVLFQSPLKSHQSLWVSRCLYFYLETIKKKERKKVAARETQSLIRTRCFINLIKPPFASFQITTAVFNFPAKQSSWVSAYTA